MSRACVLAAIAASFAIPASGCARPAGGAEAAPQQPESTLPDPGTPVKVAAVERATLALTISGPGRTDALEQQKIRAPFKGILRELRVADGDHVRKGQVLAVLVSQESQAALNGAEALLRAARTPEEESDARRALELARRGLVPAYLRAPEAGVIVSHGADVGSLVAEAQDLVTMAAAASFVFRADIVQTDLGRIHAGQPAEVRLATDSSTFSGIVHGVLPAASTNDLTASVRIDVSSSTFPERLGLFGTASITVGVRQEVAVVPAPAVLRDDITGVSQVALVSGEKVHWQRVTTGLAEGGRVEITQPALQPGTQVIVQGQVGLPDGAPVHVEP
jgi:multidrug efflux pump subunit AcrA (membrane-fusion protein)